MDFFRRGRSEGQPGKERRKLSSVKLANDRQQAAKPEPSRARWQSFLGHRTV